MTKALFADIIPGTSLLSGRAEMKRRNSTAGVGAILATSLLAACTHLQQSKNPAHYEVEIKRTSYGIPHIKAEDFGSLGFGEGYVAAQDHVCNIADAIVAARGERAKYHGVGEKNAHLLSDVVVRALQIPTRAREEFASQAAEDREWIAGYAAGYNRYLRDTGRDNISSWCRGAEWVREISPEDLFARFQIVAQSAPRMAGMIGAATPPANGQTSARSDALAESDETAIAAAFDDFRAPQFGSNGWALGRERTENGRGMLLGNPHYPWSGTNRLWEKHLIIPGKVNLYGVHLIGVPGVAIGFNESIGWTHTVSASERVTFYKLDLVPGDPTSYYFDGKPRKLRAEKVRLPVKGDDGALSTEERTVWFSHYGPMVVLPGAPWTTEQAITMRDANFPNRDLFVQWKEMGMARDMDAFKQAHRKWNATPWVNSMATSRDGRAVYIDGSNVGRLSDEAIALWRERKESDELTRSFHKKMGLILLDGSDSRNEWQAHPEARIPGVVPFVEQPQQERSDYIFNSNDSYWLTNPSAPLTGYSPLYGPEATGRSLRTRMNARLLSDTSPDGPSGIDGKFSLQELQQALLSNRSITAELLLDELLAICSEQTSVSVAEKQIDLGEACAALAEYSGRLDIDSKGAVLFREWITRYSQSDRVDAGELFAMPFDHTDPVNTPRGLANEELALERLGEAVEVLQRAGLALDSTLGETQFAYRAGEKIVLHGGGRAEGVPNLISQRRYETTATQVRGEKVDGSRFLTDKGYAITYGTSFLLSLSFTDDGPVAEAFLTYGESGDPSSAHYTDQTKLFSRKEWRPVLYKAEDIDRNTLSSAVLSGPRKAH